MANWSVLKAAIANVIKTNGNQEITGALLQNTLTNIVTSVGENATFAGIANTTTNPGVPDGPVFYIADTPGIYSNFSGIHLDDTEIALLVWKNKWFKKQINVPTNYTIRRIHTNIGLPEYPTFRDDKPYKVGDMVVYQDVIYKFFFNHVAGPWKGDDAAPHSLKKQNDIRTDELYMRTRAQTIDDLSFNFWQGSFIADTGAYVEKNNRISSSCFTGADDAYIKVEVGEGYKFQLFSYIDFTREWSQKGDFKVGSFFIIGIKKDDDSDFNVSEYAKANLTVSCVGTKKNDSIAVECSDTISVANTFNQVNAFENRNDNKYKNVSSLNIIVKGARTIVLNIPDNIEITYSLANEYSTIGDVAGKKIITTSRIIQNEYDLNFLNIKFKLNIGNAGGILLLKDLQNSYISILKDKNISSFGSQTEIDKTAFILNGYIDSTGNINVLRDSTPYLIGVTGKIIKPDDATHFRFKYFYGIDSRLINLYDENNKLLDLNVPHPNEKGVAVGEFPSNTHHLIVSSRITSDFNPKLEFLKVDNTHINESVFTKNTKLSDTGTDIDDSTGIVSTDFIPIDVNVARNILFSGSLIAKMPFCAFYDSRRVIVGTVYKLNEESLSQYYITVPKKDDIKYVRFSALNENSTQYKRPIFIVFRSGSNIAQEIDGITNLTPVKINRECINYNIPELVSHTSRTDPIKEPQINGNWSGWLERRYNFGVTPNLIPQPFHVKTQTISEGTIICAGTTNYIRWGFHVFEGYASDKKSRITMLVNKHNEESKKVAELYYYGTVYTHSASSYNWFKLGSDVSNHSFMFDRDNAVFFGKADMRSVIELAPINLDSDIITTYKTVEDADNKYEAEFDSVNNAKCIKYLQLKNARDGAMWYDSKNKKVLIKVSGKWHYITLTEANSDDYNVIT